MKDGGGWAFHRHRPVILDGQKERTPRQHHLHFLPYRYIRPCMEKNATESIKLAIMAAIISKLRKKMRIIKY